MKRFLSLALVALSVFMSCSKFDDSEIWDKLNDHEKRIIYLEELCKRINTEVTNLQAIVTALEANDYIVNASPLAAGDGYTFVFKSGKSIVVYDGKDGADGVAPEIGVRKDADGLYYWTINNEWLLVDGHKVKAAATDGEDGANGNDGITPKFKIEDEYWYISYDDGESWDKLGKATGNNGLNGENGEDGDSLFKRVFIEDGYVCFEMNDDNNSIIRIPLQKDTLLEVTLSESGTLRSVVSSEEARVTTKLKVRGKINNQDMMFIQHFSSLIELDMSEAVFYEYTEEYRSGVFYLNPYKEALVNRTLRKVWLPLYESISVNYSYCANLEHLIVPPQESYSWYTSEYENASLSFCPMLQILEYSEGVINIPSDKPISVTKNMVTTSFITNSKYSTIILPSTAEIVEPDFLRFDREITATKMIHYMRDFNVVCKAAIPPTFKTSNTAKEYIYNYINCTLYVPSESLDAYKEHSVWGQFNVLPIN